MSVYVYAFGQKTGHISMPDQWRPLAERLVPEGFAANGCQIAARVLKERLPEAQSLIDDLPAGRFQSKAAAHEMLGAFVRYCERNEAEIDRSTLIQVISSQPIKKRVPKKKDA